MANISYNDPEYCDSNANEIPSVDYLMLFSEDAYLRSNALNHLTHACQRYGCFYLVNHDVPGGVLESVFKGISDFFDQTEEERSYEKKDPTDRIRSDMQSSTGENREYIKFVAHPLYHCPLNPPRFREAMEEYLKRMRSLSWSLGKAISKTLGMEEDYLEKALKLESGFDVCAINLYPPNSESKSEWGLPEHTDPGFFVSLIQDNVGGLQVMTDHNPNWINVNMPGNDAIFINLGDHLEILTNGKYKSHVHRVVVGNNKVKRISVATLHGPSLEAFIRPATEFSGDPHHPPAYRGATYKQSLEANGYDEIDVQSSLQLLRLNNNN